MRKTSSSFEAAYNALQSLGTGPVGAQTIATLKLAIDGANSLLVSAAADIAGRRKLHDLVPDMISAFESLMTNGSKKDKLCNAKISIVNALNEMEYMGDEVLVAGAKYVQIEPAYGGPVDTAVQVRIGCAFGLARTEHTDALYILTDLLVDPDSSVRAAAAKATAYLGRPESEHLLRLKAHAGDSDPEVVRECLDGLITMAPDRSIDFLVRFLDSPAPAISQSAALAIGNSRVARAYDLLRERWDSYPSPTIRRGLILPIALVRTDEAFQFLLDVLRNAESNTAKEALSALRVYATDDSLRKIRRAVIERKDDQLQTLFRAEYGSVEE